MHSDQTLKNLAITLKSKGFTEESNLYQLVNCTVDFPGDSNVIKKIEYTAKLGVELQKILEFESIEQAAEDFFEYFHLEWRREEGKVYVLDDFNTVLYSFDSKKHTNLPYPPSGGYLHLYHNELVRLSVIKPFDIIVIN